jgi:hypothetical protein
MQLERMDAERITHLLLQNTVGTGGLKYTEYVMTDSIPAFKITMGSGTDLKNPGLRRMTLNAAYWGMGVEVSIRATSSADIIGTYAPPGSVFNYGKRVT